MDLITRERALRNLNSLSPTATEALTIDALIAAASRAIERFCHRVFCVEPYDELYDGIAHDTLILDHFPVISVERVAYQPTTAMTVTNTSATNQRATVKVTDNGLTLTRVASGTTTVNELTFAAYATMSALATAVIALGNGWSSQADSTFAAFPSSDLRAIQGAFTAKDVNANLRIHSCELDTYQVDIRQGALIRDGCDVISAFDGQWLTWHGGRQYWRVIYSAGYATVPDDVQEACAQWVAALFWSTKRDPGLASESLQGIIARHIHPDLPPAVKVLLRPYRNYRV